MNTPTNDGGPAFPQSITFSPNGEAVTAGMYYAEGHGMSLRDWFAGQALNGLLAAGNTVCDTTIKEAFIASDLALAERNRRAP